MVTVDAGEPLDLRHYLEFLRRRKWVILVVTVLVTAVAVLFSAQQTPQYRASGEMLLKGTEAEARLDQGAPNANDRTLVDTELGVLTSSLVRSQVADELGRSPKISASAQGETALVTVSSTSTNPEAATETVNVYMEVYLQWKRETTVQELLSAQQTVQDAMSDIQAKLDELEVPIKALEQDLFFAGEDPSAILFRAELESLRGESESQRATLNAQVAAFQTQLSQLQVSEDVVSTGGARVISPATVPASPFAPQPLRNGILGFVVGAMLAVGLAFLLETLDDRVRSKDDLERATGWSVIGLIPEHVNKKGEGELVSLTDSTSTAAESYRALRTAIQFLGIERELKVIQITSAKPADGKTTVAANLAVAMARTGRRVALLDADLRRPRMHKVFKVENDVGFTSLLLRTPNSSERAVHRLEDPSNLAIIPAGPPPPNPSELLSLQRTSDFFEQAASECDVLIVDSPPLLPVSDPLLLSEYADGIILVASAQGARRRELGRAAELLEQANANVLGIVANRVSHEDRYGYGYDYLYGYDTQAVEPTPDPQDEPENDEVGLFSN